MITPVQAALAVTFANNENIRDIERHIDAALRRGPTSRKHQQGTPVQLFYHVDLRTRSGWTYAEIEHVAELYRGAGWAVTQAGSVLTLSMTA